MSTVQNVAKNSSVIVAGSITIRFIGLIVTIYLARYLGNVVFGKYSFVFAYLAFLQLLRYLNHYRGTSLCKNYPGHGAYCNQTGNLTAEYAEGRGGGING